VPSYTSTRDIDLDDLLEDDLEQERQAAGTPPMSAWIRYAMRRRAGILCPPSVTPKRTDP
jgi:hypothetical protein